MSAESIEARAAELMSMQKIELARRVAQYEDAGAGYTHYEQPPAIEQGSDPEITDVASASTESEMLDLDTLEPIPPAQPTAAVEGADAAPADEPKDAAQ